MHIGIVGLGRMGANIARRLMRHGHACVVHDRDAEPGRRLAGEGATVVDSLAALTQTLSAPRVVWLMLPAGEITEAAIAELAGLLGSGDTIIDGGNTFWKDDIRRAGELQVEGHPLCRRRHVRRRVGAGARLLPDDRRRGCRGRAARSDLRRARAGHGRHARHRHPQGPRRRVPSRATCIAARAAPGIS